MHKCAVALGIVHLMHGFADHRVHINEVSLIAIPLDVSTLEYTLVKRGVSRVDIPGKVVCR